MKSPGRGQIRNPLAIEKALVLTAQFMMLQALSTSDDVVGPVPNVIMLVIGQMPLEDLNVLIQYIDKPDPSGQKMDRLNSSDVLGFTTFTLG